VHGENAILVPPARPDDLMTAIKRILHDAGLRGRLSEGGLRTAHARPAEREWKTMISVMMTVLRKNGPRGEVAMPEPSKHTVHHVITPARGQSGPDFAQQINRELREYRAEVLCISQEGVLGSPDWVERLRGVLRPGSGYGAVVPSILPAFASITREGLTAYEERSSRRRIPLSTLPVQAMMLRGDLVARIGLLDETRPTIEAVLDDLAFRMLLEGFSLSAVGESAVCLPPDVAHPAIYRKNPLPALMPRTGDPLDAAKKEVLRAVTAAAVLELKNRTEDAVTLLTEAIKRVPDSPRLHVERAWMLLRAGRYDHVSDLLGPTPDSVKRDPVWLDIAGYAMHGIGELALARQCMQKSLQIDQRCSAALVLKGMLAADEGDDAGAQQAFGQAIEADPSSAMAHAHAGALRWSAGDRRSACQEIARAFILSPVHPAVLASYREMIHATEDFANALTAVVDARAFYPDHRDLAIVQAEFLSGVGENATALALLVDVMAECGPTADVLELALALRERTGPLGPAQADGVSLCMIVKNEEASLARCLAGIEKFVDEIVVVDTGSSDGTVKVAAACGAQVYAVSWEDDYAAARNVAVAHANGSWVLALDADERLALSDRDRFRELVATVRRSPAGVIFTTRNYVTDAGVQGWRRNDGVYAEESGTGWLLSDKVRLFPRRTDVRYEHAVHEIVEESLQRCGLKLMRTEIPIHHYGRLDAGRTLRKAELR
jgi:tetratricopeptide (TPR) repeat protein